MAVWQFQCYIIPDKEHSDKLSFEEMISWRDATQPVMNIDFLERVESWSAETVQYGKLDETCIEFVYHNDVLEEISCRLDLRTLTKHIFNRIVEYVQNIGACFLVGGKVYPPEAECLKVLMKQSEANQYCKNPAEYLAGLEKRR